LQFTSAAQSVQAIMRPQDVTRAWLKAVLEKTGLDPTGLAAKAGLHPSTLTRFVNNENVTHDLSRRTVSGIEKATGIAYGQDKVRQRTLGLAEPEGSAYVVEAGDGDSRIDEAVRYLVQAQNGLDPWRLKSRALELAGYLPGDVLIVDLNAEPEDGDAVVAQNYDGGAETIFRIYQKPYLVAAATDRVPRRPLLVDDDTVMIRGVVVAMFRPRKGHLAAA
jgi:hypothetical protein